MRASLKICMIGCILSLGLLTQAVAAEESAASALRALSDVSNRLKTQLPGDSRISQVVTEVQELQQIYGSSGSQVSAAYVASLTLDSRLLEEAAINPQTERAKDLIGNVSADIDVKHRFALAAAPQFAGSPPTLVDVTVQVKRSGQTLSGYAVRWWSALWSNRPPVDEFNGDPLEGQIPPGRYITAAVKNGNIMVRQPKSVGLTGRTKETIDLILP